MAKTRKVGQRRHLRKKQKSRRRAKGYEEGYEEAVYALLSKKLNDVHLATYGREFVEPGKSGEPTLPSHILSYIPEIAYVRRLREALVLNKKILGDQEALIKQLKMSGVDGPSNRTRNRGRHNTDPVLEDLELEAYHTMRSIDTIQYMLSRIEQGNTDVLPQGFKSYEEFNSDKDQPGWDMARMTYTTRYRPPGYPNWR
jgi:hypothetical protein